MSRLVVSIHDCCASVIGSMNSRDGRKAHNLFRFPLDWSGDPENCADRDSLGRFLFAPYCLLPIHPGMSKSTPVSSSRTAAKEAAIYWPRGHSILMKQN